MPTANDQQALQTGMMLKSNALQPVRSPQPSFTLFWAADLQVDMYYAAPMSSDGPSRAQSLLGVSALAASQPTTGSPLNPHRNSKVIPLESDEGDDDDDDDEEEEGAVSISRTQNAHGRSSSVLSGGGDDGSEFVSLSMSSH